MAPTPVASRFARLGALVAIAALAASTMVGCSKDEAPRVGATTIAAGGVQVHAIERPGTGSTDTGLTVLFLHGQAYDSRIWDDRGILDAVAATGNDAVAVDLPGHGDTPDRDAGDGADAVSDGTWLRSLIEELGGPEEVVLVSPSMSGRYSLGYLAEHPTDALAGFVPVAPVGIVEFKRGDDAVPIPSLAIWGSEDESYSTLQSAQLLGQLGDGADKGRTEVIEGASHACYDDDPEAFIDLLVPFLAEVAD